MGVICLIPLLVIWAVGWLVVWLVVGRPHRLTLLVTWVVMIGGPCWVVAWVELCPSFRIELILWCQLCHFCRIGFHLSIIKIRSSGGRKTFVRNINGVIGTVGPYIGCGGILYCIV